MKKMSLAKRAQVLTLLCEGVSMRSIERIVGCSINTVDKLLREAGKAALAYHDKAVRGVKSPAHPMRRNLVIRSRQTEERARQLAGR